MTNYINGLINDLKNGKDESFELFQALENNEFKKQFLEFSQSFYTDLPKNTLVYEFVKYRIWSIIIHQQLKECLIGTTSRLIQICL